MVSVVLFDAESCCGPSDDGSWGVADFVAASQWLHAAGVSTARYTLSSAPQEFVSCAPVAALLTDQGAGGLPALTVDGQIRISGRYPTAAELERWTGVPGPAGAAVLAAERGASSGCCSPAAAPAQADQR